MQSSPREAGATEPLIEFRSVSKSFISQNNKVVRAMQDVSFSVRRGEFIALVGPSGCGKSTSLNVLAGLTDITHGEALIMGRPAAEATLDIGYVFQQDSVLPWRKVIDNIGIGLELRRVPAAERRDRAMALIHKMGLAGFENAFPSELSGGMRKRVALATTLAYAPSILLMDEPFGALDAQTRIILQDDLLRVWQELHQTVLFVTHDLSEAISLADRVIVMTARPGRIKKEYRIDLPRPRGAAEARFLPGFDGVYMEVWNDLRPEITIAVQD